MIFLGYGSALGYGVLCLLLSVVAYKLGMPKKYTRKMVHILVGFEWVILYNFFGASWHTFAVCVFFLLLLAVAYFAKLMPMISSDADNAPGTVYYAVSMSVMAVVSVFLPDMMLPFGIAVLCTSLGDGFAGVVGQLITAHNPKVIGNKSLFGLLANLVFSFAGTLVFKSVFGMALSVWECVLIAVFSMALELISTHGLDNITVPLGVAALTYALSYYTLLDGYAVPIVLTPLVIAVALDKKVLTFRGVIAALILDVAVSISLGNAGFIILLAFLALGVVTDKIKKHRKTEEKTHSCRNELQVFANGAVAMVCALAYLFAKKETFAVAFVAALAEALADTSSSGIGVYAKNTYDIFRMRKCEKGISGGVSVTGTIAAIIGSVLLPVLALTLGLISLVGALWAALLAFIGCFMDTLLGSLLQEKRKCVKCGKITEENIHCKATTKKHSGLSFVDNNLVNFISGAISAVLAIIIL